MKNLHYSKLDKFTQRLKVEEANRGNFYLCPNACVRVNFEKATDFEFKCPECGVVLNHQDNEKTIEFLQSKIKELHMTNGFAKMGNGFKVGNGHSVEGNGHSVSGNGHKIGNTRPHGGDNNQAHDDLKGAEDIPGGNVYQARGTGFVLNQA